MQYYLLFSLFLSSTRRIILPWGRLGSGIMLVGGRGRGIFIYSEKEDSRGLQTGDKLLKVIYYMNFFVILRPIHTQIIRL